MRLVSVQPPQRKPHKRRRKIKIVRWLLLAVLIAGIANYARPLPEPIVSINLPSTPEPGVVSVAWPAPGYGSLYVDGYGFLGSQQGDEIIATASITKVVTALCVLEKKPLKQGESGPAITMTQEDLDLYNAEVGRNGSRVYVEPGEQLTEYELLQALLIPSANNIANTLAVWAFGSLDAYRTYATDFVERHELSRTHIGTDASGFDPSTTSTANDLAKLGQLAAANPVVAEIVAQKTAVLPRVGTVYNYNSALGVAGIDGIKTGNNDQNLGGLLFSATLNVDNTNLRLTGAVLNETSLFAAISASEQLVQSVPANFETIVYAKKQQPIGTVSTSWGEFAEIRLTKDLGILRWKDKPVEAHASTPKQISMDTVSAGTITLKSGQQETSAGLALSAPIEAPSWWWRLTRH